MDGQMFAFTLHTHTHTHTHTCARALTLANRRETQTQASRWANIRRATVHWSTVFAPAKAGMRQKHCTVYRKTASTSGLHNCITGLHVEVAGHQKENRRWPPRQRDKARKERGLYKQLIFGGWTNFATNDLSPHSD